MDNIYLPIDDINDFSCYSIQSNGIIRAYYTQPRNNSNSNYIDFDTRNHYFELNGNQSWSQYSTLPQCLPKQSITNDYVYRTDFSDILIIVLVFSIFCFYLPYKVFSRIMGRWMKV